MKKKQAGGCPGYTGQAEALSTLKAIKTTGNKLTNTKEKENNG
jgi:hypothetical protein